MTLKRVTMIFTAANVLSVAVAEGHWAEEFEEWTYQFHGMNLDACGGFIIGAWVGVGLELGAVVVLEDVRAGVTAEDEDIVLLVGVVVDIGDVVLLEDIVVLVEVGDVVLLDDIVVLLDDGEGVFGAQRATFKLS
jgi:hypothetical protein